MKQNAESKGRLVCLPRINNFQFANDLSCIRGNGKFPHKILKV